MSTRLIFTFVLALAILFSCTDNEVPNELPIAERELSKDTLSVDTTLQSCDSVFIATYHATACCVSGSVVAKPGDILLYHYQINHADAHISWQVLEGDISIIAGQDTHTVTVRFGANFTKGVVYADGNGVSKIVSVRQRCTDRAIISST